MDNALIAMFPKLTDKIASGLCPSCDTPVKEDDLSTPELRKRFRDLGLCEKCIKLIDEGKY